MAVKRTLPWRRVLRRGDEGDDVAWLQQRLASFGYEVGEIDGRFGYLTEDAVIELQRDLSLRVDGIAGPQVMAALVGEAPRRRIVHELKAGERLSDLSRAYGASVDAIRWMNRLRTAARLYPGRRLVLRSTHVMAGLAQRIDRSVQHTLTTQRKNISSLAAGGLTVEPDGSISGTVDEPVRAVAREEGWPLIAVLSDYAPRPGGEHVDGPGALGDPLGNLSRVLSHRRSRRRLSDSLRERLKDEPVQGLLLEFGPGALGRSAALAAGVAALKKELPGLPLTVAAAPPPRGWRGLFYEQDYRRLGEWADRFLLTLHRWECLLGSRGETPRPQLLESWIGHTVRLVPPWKVLVGVPLGACRFSGSNRGVQEIDYRVAIAASLAQRRRPKADPNGFLRFSAGEGEHEVTYVAAGRQAVSSLITLAYRRRLGGIYLHPVGMEDRRLWELVFRRLWVEREPRG